MKPSYEYLARINQHTFYNQKQLIFGLVFLFFGCSVYLFLRAPIYDAFLPINANLISNAAGRFKAVMYVSNSLPSLFHTLSFSLLIGSFCTQNESSYLKVTVLWVFIELIFEFSQFMGSIYRPSWIKNVDNQPIILNIINFFFSGYFCLGDVAAILIGGGAALFILLSTSKRISTHD